MAALDSTQFNQLVQEVREALLASSQGVSEVEVATSLDNLVSLPALRLIGATETVVEAPLELLSAPAVEAAADARKATDDAIVAAVNAAAAADLSEAERKDLDEIKLRTIIAGTDASAKGDKAFAGAMNAENATLYAMKTAFHLQTKLEQAQVVILSGKANQDVLDSLDSQVKDSTLVCARTREDAYAAILQLRELQKQVAGSVLEAYVQFDSMSLSTADARIATELAYKATAKMEELSDCTQRVIIESVLQTGKANQTIIRLEDLEKELLFSRSAADIAASRARENAELARKVKEATELVRIEAVCEIDRTKEATAKADGAADKALFSKSDADIAAYKANEKADKADKAAEDALISKTEADIAAARALVGEQRAIDAAKTAENLVAGIRPDWNEADKTNSNYITNKPEIPTLEAEPTADTLTYVNKDGNEVAYKIGDEVRVWDADYEEYGFYKLYDIQESKAVWDEVGGGNKLPGDILLSPPSTFSSDEELVYLNNGVLNL